MGNARLFLSTGKQQRETTDARRFSSVLMTIVAEGNADLYSIASSVSLHPHSSGIALVECFFRVHTMQHILE